MMKSQIKRFTRVFYHIEESAKSSEAKSAFVGLFDDFDVNNNKLDSMVAKRNEKFCFERNNG